MESYTPLADARQDSDSNQKEPQTPFLLRRLRTFKEAVTCTRRNITCCKVFVILLPILGLVVYLLLAGILSGQLNGFRGMQNKYYPYAATTAGWKTTAAFAMEPAELDASKTTAIAALQHDFPYVSTRDSDELQNVFRGASTPKFCEGRYGSGAPAGLDPPTSWSSHPCCPPCLLTQRSLDRHCAPQSSATQSATRQTMGGTIPRGGRSCRP